MKNSVELFELRHAHLLAAFERPLASVTGAFEFGMRAYNHLRYDGMSDCLHRANYVPVAKVERDRYLEKFGYAHAARGILSMAAELPDRETATSMIVDMLAGITGQQPEPQTVISMLAALTGDRVGNRVALLEADECFES